MAEHPKGVDWLAVRKWFTPIRIVGAALLVAGLLVAVGGSLYVHNTAFGAVDAFYANAGTELISIAITVLVIDTLMQHREMQRERARLIREMGSTDNSTTLGAVRELRAHRWGFGGDKSLQGANLRDANLQGARLDFANLEGAALYDANLQGARLVNANLQGARLDFANLEGAALVSANLKGVWLEMASLEVADLRDASLQGAGLSGANLQGGNLSGANLKGARLVNANLQGVWLEMASLEVADLRDANLQGAVLDGAKFDENTTLPDGTKWTPDIDMDRFTDPEYPDFWQPAAPYSPSHRGDDDD